MSNIKKAFMPIVELLQANQDTTVADILPQIVELTAAKTGAGGGKASTFHRNDAGDVIAVKCYYHGLWMHVAAVEFGEKKSSASGLNSMSKDGTSKWTKQNAGAKKAKEALLTRVAEGEITANDLPSELKRIEEERAAIIPMEGEYVGFETLEECLTDAEERGLNI